MSTPYLPPLDQLLVLGEPEFGHRKKWLDYLAMGFTAEHVPELVRMATDPSLASDDSELPAAYGAVHAWRALGQLRAEAAMEPLLRLLEDDDDWAREELPRALAMMGPPAFEPLRAALARWSRDPEPWAAASAANGLVEMAQRFPETRDAVLGVLARQLRWWARHDPILNTMLIHDLVELGAVEAAPEIEAAFAAGAVDTWFDDDWEDVQVSLGLLAERVTPRPEFAPAVRLHPIPAGSAPPAKAAADRKARRKAEKAARQRNRQRG
jgi:HEAT repeat protein